MKRQVSLEEISDGRLYGRHDLVRVGCGGCRGCSQCCHGMGNSAILDPLDIFRLIKGTGLSFEELLVDKIELNVVDGVILPNLAMRQDDAGTAVGNDRCTDVITEAGENSLSSAKKQNLSSEDEEVCGFLDGQGRCSIHSFRPGVCRLFPLGRYYLSGDGRGAGTEEASDARKEPGVGAISGAGRRLGVEALSGAGSECGNSTLMAGQTTDDVCTASSFRYFLQVHECPAPNKTKVRVEKWLEQPDLARYEAYILKWHNFLERMERLVAQEMTKAEEMKPDMKNASENSAGRNPVCGEAEPDRAPNVHEENVKTINLYILQMFFVKPYDPDGDFYTEFEARLAAMENALLSGAE